MEKVEFPMSALEIMQACLICFVDNAEKSENAEKAESYLKIVKDIINGETYNLSNEDFSELHKFVITVYSGILEKGEVIKGKWTNQHWKKVLENIEKYAWNRVEKYQVSKMIK